MPHDCPLQQRLDGAKGACLGRPSSTAAPRSRPAPRRSGTTRGRSGPSSLPLHLPAGPRSRVQLFHCRRRAVSGGPPTIASIETHGSHPMGGPIGCRSADTMRNRRSRLFTARSVDGDACTRVSSLLYRSVKTDTAALTRLQRASELSVGDSPIDTLCGLLARGWSHRGYVQL